MYTWNIIGLGFFPLYLSSLGVLILVKVDQQHKKYLQRAKPLIQDYCKHIVAI